MIDIHARQAAESALAEGKTRLVTGLYDGLIGVAFWVEPTADLSGAFEAIDADGCGRFPVVDNFEHMPQFEGDAGARLGLMAQSPMGSC